MGNFISEKMWGWGAAAEPEPVKEPEPVVTKEPEPVVTAEPEPEEDLGVIGNAWKTTTDGVVYGATKTKDGFVYVSVGAISAVGNGFEWCSDTVTWAYDGTTDWGARTFGCGGATA